MDERTGPSTSVRSIQLALRHLDGLTPAQEEAAIDAEAPVFLLSTSWRSGSTLLQRILMTDRSLLLWGEPFGSLALIPRVTEALCAAPTAAWPRPEVFATDTRWSQQDLTRSWIADFYPPADAFKRGLRNWLLGWMGAPARDRGYARWGVKECRFGAAEACLLRWLFPQARFVVLVRDPVAAYRSARTWKHVWSRWPDLDVSHPSDFARHWNRLGMSWSELPESFGHVVVRYEELVSGTFDFRRLEAQLGLSLRERDALDHFVGESRAANPIAAEERTLIDDETREARRLYGYPTETSYYHGSGGGI